MTPKSLAWVAFAAFSFQMGVAQDFKRSYTISENGLISIRTTGNIKVLGYKGHEIEVIAYKKGSSPNAFEIEDASSENRIDLHLRFAQFDPGKFDPGKVDPRKVDPRKVDPRKVPSGRFPPGVFPPPRFDLGDSSVDFEILMPKSTKYESWLISNGGSVEVSNVSGRLFVKSERGNVIMKDVRGFIRGTAVFNGSIRVELGSNKEPNDMNFFSMSGDVTIVAPGNLDAAILMTSDSGRIKTDFPIEIKDDRYGHKRIAEGKLGSGKQKITIGSNFGGVSLLKK
jgi:hypothetical protein